jgi:predicted nucleic acid-binding protein
VILYLDTSAFAKLVLKEPETAVMRDLFDQADYAVTSVITYPEATSALYRQDRELGPEDQRLVDWIAVLDDRWRRCVRLPVAEQLAGRVVVAHGLRGMDAVQLAAAVTLRARVLEAAPQATVSFATFDRQLLVAAAREGFATLGGTLE